MIETQVTETVNLEEYLRKHPEVEEWLRIWNISIEEYLKALKLMNFPYQYPIGVYEATS
jgi:hypothetical protein